MLMRPYTKEAPSQPRPSEAEDAVADLRAKFETEQRRWKQRLEVLNARHVSVNRQIDLVLMVANPDVVATFADAANRQRTFEWGEVRSFRDDNGELDVTAYRAAIRDQQQQNHERVRAVLTANKETMRRIEKIERDCIRALHVV